MSNENNAIQHIISLHNLILSQHQRNGKANGVERMNRLIKEINEVGYIEGLGIEGIQGRYLLIDGKSWEQACRDLTEKVVPSYVMWEETDFLSFLKSLIANQDKNRLSRKEM
jgi:ParB-like chromosome segregation protein Spo0J